MPGDAYAATPDGSSDTGTVLSPRRFYPCSQSGHVGQVASPCEIRGGFGVQTRIPIHPVKLLPNFPVIVMPAWLLSIAEGDSIDDNRSSILLTGFAATVRDRSLSHMRRTAALKEVPMNISTMGFRMMLAKRRNVLLLVCNSPGGFGGKLRRKRLTSAPYATRWDTCPDLSWVG
jgi:hypothetical protein